MPAKRGERPTPDNSTTAALHLPGMLLDELRTWLVGEGLERFRADQIVDWVFTKGATSFNEMTNLSKALRARLQERCRVYRSTVSRESVSQDGTRKLLLTWPDGAAVETVWIPDEPRHTACLSSQVGCPVGCAFCASGLDGLQRNLTAGEIVEQALRVQHMIRRVNGTEPIPPLPTGGRGRVRGETAGTPTLPQPLPEREGGLGSAGKQDAVGGATEPGGGRLTNIVVMGMGEPLANYDAVVKALRILNAPWGLNIGARKITVSTVGLPRQIRRLAEEDLQLNLALSLHAPDNALRRELIPWSKAPIAELLDACDYYFQRSGREITLEYVLLDGLNHRPAHARQLATIARRLRCNVNLLRYNPVPGLAFGRPSAADAYEFQRRLRDMGVNAHVRTSRGSDIDAACGQLRRSNT